MSQVRVEGLTKIFGNAPDRALRALEEGRTKDEILAAFETRIGNDRAEEFATACKEVERIALLRLRDLLPL
jgi:2-oxo-4-hydroxy-4-carboxy--5-ureidoimidazoline (OHCU) decarboxylase